MNEVTEDELEMIKYFCREKEDFTRYVEWERLEPLLRKSHPHFFIAFENWKAYRKILDDVIDAL